MGSYLLKNWQPKWIASYKRIDKLNNRQWINRHQKLGII